MKKLSVLFSFYAIALFCSSAAFAQVGYIYTVAGNGVAGYSGDGGPAQSAQLNHHTDVCEDNAGNIYLVDQGNNRIRKINASTHIITTVAGTGAVGYSGDGGSAAAATLNTPNGIAVDGIGNIYIADQSNHVIRKVSPSGIISTIAGTGALGFTGDGGYAVAAKLTAPTSVAVDNAGNIYIGDNGNHRIRKINTLGVITTIAGGGSTGFSTDGVAGTSVSLCTIHHLAVDAAGNVYFTDQGCIRYLKLTPSGLLYLELGIYTPWGVSTDISGNVYMATHGNLIVRKNAATSTVDTLVRNTGSSSALGDGGPAISGHVSSPDGICADIMGNLYVADYGNNRIRLVTSSIIATYSSDSFAVFINEHCSGPDVTISTTRYSSSFSQTTFFGDGNSYSSSISGGYGGTAGYTTFTHNYTLPGTYTLKTILRDGTTIIDTQLYTYQYKMCNTLQARFYVDANSSNAYESGSDILSSYPVTTEIDSNGIPVDTIVSTSGFYYQAYGAPGDIYKMKIIGSLGGLMPTSPATGVITDTLQSLTYNLGVSSFGLNCSPAPGPNYRIHTANRCGSHHFGGDIIVDNLYCSGVGSPVTVTVKTSPKYSFQSASPAPTSVSGTVITWNLPGLSSASMPTHISLSMEKPSGTTSYMPGDTVHSFSIINPLTGDIDTTDNVWDHTDTVKSGYDPNFIEVYPGGYVASGSQLQYTIGFENTGNDTAFNIYILDTLSDDLDPATLSIVTASAFMDIYKFTAGGHTIVKFDFPNINLQDSSHHDACHGMVVYTIKTRTGLPDCRHIPNEAGIYFDLNPVVMTNMVQTIIGIPPPAAAITGAANVCIGGTVVLSASIPGGTWSVNNTNASVSASGVVTGNTSGTVFVYYTIPGVCDPVTSQFLMNVGIPSAGAITSPSSVCTGSTITLTETVSGGIWSGSNGNSTITGNVLSAIAVGSDTVYYTVTTPCGSATTQQIITIDTFISVTPILGANKVCEATTIVLTNATGGGVWSATNGHATVSAGVVTGISPGVDTIIYTISNACGPSADKFIIHIIPAEKCGMETNINNTPDETSLSIYPNPANSKLFIVTDEGAYRSLAITNNVGQVVLQRQITTTQTQLDIAPLSPGFYYITLTGNNGNVVRKFVKM